MGEGVSRRFWLVVVVAAATAFGAAADEGGTPNTAQPKLRTVPLTITAPNGTAHRFTVELAVTPREQEIGLMFRRSVPADSGMLFTWSRPQVSQMWMMNTLVPLDMVFIDANNRVDSVAENTVPRSLAVIASSGPVVATLELAAGTTAKLGINVGDRVSSTALQRPG